MLVVCKLWHITSMTWFSVIFCNSFQRDVWNLTIKCQELYATANFQSSIWNNVPMMFYFALLNYYVYTSSEIWLHVKHGRVKLQLFIPDVHLIFWMIIFWMILLWIIMVLTLLRKNCYFFWMDYTLYWQTFFVKNGCHGWWVKYALLMFKYSLSHDLQNIKLRYFSAWLRIVHCISSCQQKKLMLDLLFILIKDMKL